MMNTRFNSTFSSLSAFCALLIALTLSSTGCWKEPVQPIPSSPLIYKIIYDSLGLPTHTQIGIGSLGFLLNDTAWLPGCGSLLTPEGQKIYSDGSNLNTLNKCNGNNKRLKIRIPTPTTVGTFSLSDPSMGGFDAYYIDYAPKEPNITRKAYICSQKGYANCRFNVDFYDPQKRIRSGTFDMVMYRVLSNFIPYNTNLAERDQYLNLNDSIVIRSGRYDVVGYQ
jgi:hypothetical protein